MTKNKNIHMTRPYLWKFQLSSPGVEPRNLYFYHSSQVTVMQFCILEPLTCRVKRQTPYMAPKILLTYLTGFFPYHSSTTFTYLPINYLPFPKHSSGTLLMLPLPRWPRLPFCTWQNPPNLSRLNSRIITSSVKVYPVRIYSSLFLVLITFCSYCKV